MTVLHLKYRPKVFSEVIGQDAVVASLSKALDDKGTHAVLLSGPSGTGKTTLARIAARVVGCSDESILEIDAATFTGIDAMRQIQDGLQYLPFGEAKSRAIIIDEAHGLSRQAWQSLLKIIEEPPAHVYWFLCTTELDKVPVTIRSRCAAYPLKSVPDRLLLRLLGTVVKKEGIKLSDGVRDLIVNRAMGSPRQMLVNLALCRDVGEDRKAAATLLQTALESDPILELCRFLVKGGSWTKAAGIVERIDEAPEGVRIVVCRYLASALRGATSDRSAMHLLHILEQFSDPYPPGDDRSPLFLSVGRALFSS